MKTVRNLTILIAVVVVFAFLTVAPTFAAGSPYTPYSPYNGHPPTDTALGGIADAVVVTGISAYVVGLGVILYASKFKALIGR